MARAFSAGRAMVYLLFMIDRSCSVRWGVVWWDGIYLYRSVITKRANGDWFTFYQVVEFELTTSSGKRKLFSPPFGILLCRSGGGAVIIPLGIWDRGWQHHHISHSSLPYAPPANLLLFCLSIVRQTPQEISTVSCPSTNRHRRSTASICEQGCNFHIPFTLIAGRKEYSCLLFHIHNW